MDRQVAEARAQQAAEADCRWPRNLTGAADVVAVQRAVSSPADGYTLQAGSSNEMAATVLVNPAQRYDPVKDLTPVMLAYQLSWIFRLFDTLNLAAVDTGATRWRPPKLQARCCRINRTCFHEGRLISTPFNRYGPHLPP
ncbi:hypothetical protein D3C87_1302100 [compost metagenome]